MHMELIRTLQQALEASKLADDAVRAAVDCAEGTGDPELASALAYLRRPLRTVRETLLGFYEVEEGPAQEERPLDAEPEP